MEDCKSNFSQLLRIVLLFNIKIFFEKIKVEKTQSIFFFFLNCNEKIQNFKLKKFKIVQTAMQCL